MEMRKFSLLLVLISLSIAGMAQKIRFTDTSNHWNLLLVIVDNPGEFYTVPMTYSYTGDTVIAGNNYSMMLSSTCIVTTLLALREDTVQGRIYFRTPLLTDTTEHLLFDYNLKIGDTLKVNYDKYSWVNVVRSIDSVKLGGVYHKTWDLGAYQFIEGIGTESGPTYGIQPWVFEQGYQLRCFTTHGFQPVCDPHIKLPFGQITSVSPNNVLPVSYFDNNVSCMYHKTDVVATGKSAEMIQIAPNPGNTEMSLTLPNSISSALFRVNDMTGRTCLDLNLIDRKTNIGQYLSVPGVYTYTLQDAATGQRFNGRFVFR
jgi:hypothetical protein